MTNIPEEAKLKDKLKPPILVLVSKFGFMCSRDIDIAEYCYAEGLHDGIEQGELQQSLLDLTVLNQNAPKILLTNDEAGWYITYLPEPPSSEGEIVLLGDNPFDATRRLIESLKGEK